MNGEQLYRIDQYAEITDDTLIVTDQHTGGTRALVPAKIDYEAAAESIWNESSFSLSQLWSDAPLEYRSKYRVLATTCVNAALGIGG